MTTLAVDSPLTIVTGDFNAIGIIADDIVFEGALVGDNFAGYGRPLVAGDLFVGHSLEQVVNTGGLAGAKNIRLRTGRYRGKVTISGVLITDVGKEVYASDDDTYTLSSYGNSRVGVVIRYDSTNKAIVEFQTNEPQAESMDREITYGDIEVGGSYQGIFELSATKNYAIGTRRTTPDGRTFHFANAGATLNTDLLAQSQYHVQEVASAAVQADADAGSTTLAITVGGGDGDGSGNIGADVLKNGSIIIFPGSENSINMRITGNTEVSSGGTMTLTLEEGLPIDITTSMSVECMANPYLDVRAGTAGDVNKSFVGLPMRAATTLLPYHWEMTWGRCWVAPANGYGDHNPGSQARSNQVVARYNGTLMVHDDDNAESEYQQHVGFIMTRAQANGQGAPFIMLQICP